MVNVLELKCPKDYCSIMFTNKIKFNFQTKKFLIFRSDFLFITILINLQFMVFQYLYRSRHISPDFLIFYESTERFLSGKNLYFSQDGGIGFAPTFLYFILSPLTIFDQQTASNIFIAINYILIFFIIFILSRYLPAKNLLIVLTVLNASYSIRSIINNGQIGIIVLILQLFFLILINKNSLMSLILKSTILFMLLELKPYLVLPYFIYLVVSKKKEAFLAISYALIFEFIYFLINPTSTMFHYVQLLLKRSKEIKIEVDQASLFSLVSGNTFIFISFLLMISILIFRNFPKCEQKRAIILFLVAPLISIYFHRQDSVFAILIFALLVAEFNSYLVTVLFFLLLHTGTLNVFYLLQIFLMLLVLKLLIPLTKRVGLIVAFSLLLYSYIIHGVAINSGYQASYRLWTPLVFLFQFFVFVYFVRFNKNINVLSNIPAHKPSN